MPSLQPPAGQPIPPDEPVPAPSPSEQRRNADVVTAVKSAIADTLPAMLAAHSPPGGVHQQPPQETGVMGLRGWAKNLANITAVGLICLLFYQWQQAQFQHGRDSATQTRDQMKDMITQFKEDRVMFRAELAIMHDDSRRKWEAIQKNTDSSTAVASTVAKQNEAIAKQNQILSDLITEVRKIKATPPGRLPQPEDEGPALLRFLPPWISCLMMPVAP